MEQRRRWEESTRFEELDSDSEDEGVQLSDSLHFTGIDLGAQRERRVYEYSDSEEEDDEEEPDQQLAMLEKEEVLVQRAMERIRRAQMLGKPNVKLPVQERDALERKIESDKARGRKPLVALGGKKRPPEARRTSKNDLTVAKTKRSSRTSLGRPEPNPPGMLIPGPNGQPVFAPIGYYPPMPSDSRPTSSQTLVRTQARRQNSGGEPSSSRSQRMLPDDPNWQPRPRSTSAAGKYAYAVDAYGYQRPPPIPPQYQSQPVQTRRNITYPEIHQSYAPPSSSEPALQRFRRESSNESESSEESSEDEGVELDVVPVQREYKVVPRSAPGRSKRRQN